MFYLLHLYGVENCLQNVELDEVEEFRPIVTCNVQDFSQEFKECAEHFLRQKELATPTNPTEAMQLYIYLLKKIGEQGKF